MNLLHTRVDADRPCSERPTQEASMLNYVSKPIATENIVWTNSPMTCSLSPVQAVEAQALIFSTTYKKNYRHSY